MISKPVSKCVEIREKVYYELPRITLGTPTPNRRKATLIHTDTATIDG